MRNIRRQVIGAAKALQSTRIARITLPSEGASRQPHPARIVRDCPVMMHDIRFLDLDGIRTAVDWARLEGWNPGLWDAEAFAAADPQGFLGLYEQGELAATISIVGYDGGFGFLGFHIAKPAFRGKGLGLALWNHALERSPARRLGLDGAKAQRANHRKSGFALAHENIRFGGLKPAAYVQDDPDVVPLSSADAADVTGFERRHHLFAARRTKFLSAWLAHDSLALKRGGEIVGYGVVRRCGQGHKIGPLFALSPGDAVVIFRGLLTRVPDGMIFIDVPAANHQAVALATSLNLAPMFETARMYRGPAPDLDTSNIFGLTTFELG